MDNTDDSKEMLFRSIACFSDDGKLDVDELNQIVQIALRDGELDTSEKKVLVNIISNLTRADLTPDLWDRVEQLVIQFDLGEPA